MIKNYFITFVKIHSGGINAVVRWYWLWINYEYPSQLQGSGLKSATVGVMYTKKIGKVHKFRVFPRHLKKSGC